MKKIMILLALMVFTMSCERIEKGTVVKKHYEPRRTYTTMTRVGKINVPQTNVDDEDWVITFQGKLEGEMKERSVEVTEHFYNSTQVGDFVNFEKK